MSNSESHSVIAEAEQFVQEPVQKNQPRKKNPLVLNILLPVLLILFVFSAVRFVMNARAQAEPSYELPPVDSAYVVDSAILLENYVSIHGRFPEGFMDYTESAPLISLTVNNDGSFTYTEGDVVYRSSPGIITPGGEL